jgi:hypothetical protein
MVTSDEIMLAKLFERLRDCLHEHNRLTNDMASEALARILESEAHLKRVS